MKVASKSPLERHFLKLAASGDAAKAQDLATAIVKWRIPFASRQARRFLFKASGWMMRSGYFEQGARPWEQLSAARQDLSEKTLVRLWWKYGVYDSHVIEACRKLLRKRLSAPVSYIAVRILSITGSVKTSDLDSLAAQQRRFSGKNSRQAGNALLAIAECYQQLDENHPEIERILSLKPAGKQLGQSPKLAAKANDLGIELSAAARACAELYRSWSLGNDTIWKRLADPETTVAIVGNSPCEKGLGKGAEIDAHDIVIRFNLATVSAQHQPDYGAKTNLAVCNTDTLERILNSDCSVDAAVLTGFELAIQNKSVPWLGSAVKNGLSIATIPEPVTQDLVKALGAAPSSGIQMVAAVLATRPAHSRTGLFGFAFTDQVGPNATSANFAKNSSPTNRHNWSGEKKVFQAMTKDTSLAAGKLPAAPREFRDETETYQPIRFKFLGDHSKYHCGSAAVAKVILQQLSASGVVVKDDNYDVLVVNGEGSMHHDSTAHTRKMEALTHAIETGRKGVLINSVWQDNSDRYDGILAKLEQIVVRESLSQAELSQKHGIASKVIPDLSFQCPWKNRAPLFAPKGKVLITDFYAESLGNFAILNGGKWVKMPFFDLKKLSWDQAVSTLKQNELLVTGRHHAVYAACRARTPFVAMKGNTHKIEGIVASAGAKIPILESLRDVEATIDWAKKNPQAYEDLFDWMEAQPPWRLEISP